MRFKSTKGCDDVRELLSLRVTDDLSQDEAEAVDRHVRYCTACRAELAAYERSLTVLADCRCTVLPTDGCDSLWRRIEPRLGPAPRFRRPSFAWISTRQLAAACMALFALTLTVEWRRAAQQHPDGELVKRSSVGTVGQGLSPVATVARQNDSSSEVWLAAPLGVVVGDPTPRPDHVVGIHEQGARVVLVSPQAARRGILRGDVIIRCNGRSVRSAPQFVRLLEDAVATGEIDLEIERSGQLLRTVMNLSQEPQLDGMPRLRSFGTTRDPLFPGSQRGVFDITNRRNAFFEEAGPSGQ